MPVYKVNVKWQKERFSDVQCNTDQSPEIFKAMLFSLTGVPPDRQKVMMPGRMLGDDNFDGIKLKDGSTIMLVGSSEDLPSSQPVVIAADDHSLIENAPVKLPFGLTNLGNTCYVNATVQLLYSIPELRAVLQMSPPPLAENNSSVAVVQCLRLLFTSLANAKEPVVPAVFVACLRSVFPQFATPLESTKSNSALDGSMLSMFAGRFAQQDANECWVELVRALQCISLNPRIHNQLPNILYDPCGTNEWNFVERYFTGKLTIKLTCSEADEEPTETEESFTQLSCFINQDVKFLHTGIRNGFEGTVTKRSVTLGRDVVYKKTSVITRLPGYLCIHFVRFFYKEDKKINAKILKDVKFPMELDLFTFCSESLQKELLPTREKMRLQEDRLVHSAPKIEKVHVTSKSKNVPNPLKNPELFEPYSLERDPGSNNSGFYELMGVLSHQGRTSASGHYVAWVKVDDDWVKFDDHVVTFVSPDEILRLSGGGEYHCAYVLLYGPKRVLKYTSDVDSCETAEPVREVVSGDRLPQ